MSPSVFHILGLLLAFLSLASCKQWYQRGHTNFLTWDNFDKAVTQPNKFKFVKYFTQSCGYCRKLKHVTEKLLTQKSWSFEMYDVDCTDNYDLCTAKAPFVDSYPYVVIYNLEGGMEASLDGYYPYETMKEAFTNIEKLQEKALKQKGIKTESPTIEAPKHTQTTKTQEKEVKKEAPLPTSHEVVEVETHHEEVKAQTHETHPKQTQHKNNDEEEGSSWREGLKIGIILLGVWMWDKMVAPYLKSASDSMEKSRIIEIPVSGSKGDASWAKKEDETDKLLSDKL